MSFTTANLDAIESAIASGELTVSFNDRTVTYRSINDLIKARNTIKAQLREDGAIPAKSRRFSVIS
jgi:hypothetical protein